MKVILFENYSLIWVTEDINWRQVLLHIKNFIVSAWTLFSFSLNLLVFPATQQRFNNIEKELWYASVNVFIITCKDIILPLKVIKDLWFDY